MSGEQMALKRCFDLLLAIFGLVTCGWLILLGWLAARLSTGESGMFRQQRVGKDGKVFRIAKLRTMRSGTGAETTCTSADDPRITKVGRWLRVFKLDELPQLWNVLLGEMSFVGPRPDVPGFADALEGEDRVLLSLRPGITGPASLLFHDEEQLLNAVEDPETYNREVLWPAKVQLNLHYLKHYSLLRDLAYIFATVLPPLRKRVLDPLPKLSALA
ncbi:MAG: sugar transferase [Planctomycetes bacterium]|nr:sugar transferase [Planctomycetota bacterium]MCP4860319.1 sugar transferase [Planctomycetota bacterium]